jgi:hypothetical protein
MPVRSHVDLCTFTRFMHAQRHDLDDAVVEALDQELPVEELRRLYWAQLNNQLSTSFHESYHFWQGLRLPYLHRYAVLTFVATSQAFVQLALLDPNWHHWTDIATSQFSLLGTKKYNIWFVDDAIIIRNALQGLLLDASPLTLSALDLIETAASLAEFQVASRRVERTDPIKFGRWTKRHPTYRGAYDYTARALGDQSLALRCTLPAINVSFETTDPVRAFCTLISYFGEALRHSGEVQEFVAQDEPCQWGRFFRDLLDAEKFDDDGDVGNLLDESYFRLDPDQWVGARSSWSHILGGIHPFLSGKADEWSSIEAEKPYYGWLLDQPGWVSPDQIQEALGDFSPITVMRFHAGHGRDKVISMGNVPRDEEGEEDLVLAQILMAYGSIRRATDIHFDADSRLCHHADCPEYESNYCNCFLKVPKQWPDCKFPSAMENLISGFRDM